MMKKKLISVCAVMLAGCLALGGASACTAIYAGAGLTEDGAAVFGRSEDFANSANKLFSVSPAGAHKAGEVYRGCYGFTWTFTHDSYGYTAFSDDNGPGVNGVCPNGGGTHPHTPYQAAGTNDRGLTVSATETLAASEEALAADPYEDDGIEEAEMATILLSEAATAREAVKLITGIFDTRGSSDGSGIFVADAREIWYIENVTGHEYVALKLPESLLFIQPNLSIIGLIDLDDTENVIASPRLMETAQEAGIFVGDAAQRQIDYRATYNADQVANDRLKAGLKYLNSAYDFGENEPDKALYTISNVGADGGIVPLYNGMRAEKPLAIADVQGFYRIPGIGFEENLETHLFQISGDRTVEWVAMNHAMTSPFIPYIPSKTTETDASYQVSTALAVFTEEQPEEGVYYPASIISPVDGRVVEGYRTLPANWAESMYWSYDALSNLMAFGDVTEEQKAGILAAVEAKQAQINAEFAALPADADMTKWSMAQAKAVHALAVGLVKELLGE